MKIYYCIVLALVNFSCSTVNTVAPAHNHINISHGKNKSYCKSVPRVYSGTFYNFCTLYGEPNKSAITDATTHSFRYWATDSIFSIAFDTVILPYTIYSQIDKGSIGVN